MYHIHFGDPVHLLMVVEDAVEQTEFDGCKVDGALLVGLTFSSGSSSRILKVWALRKKKEIHSKNIVNHNLSLYQLVKLQKKS